MFLCVVLQYFADKSAQREIQALKVQCSRCNWEGHYGESRSHFRDCLESCQFCGKKMSFYDLDRHTASCTVFLSKLGWNLGLNQQETNTNSRLASKIVAIDSRKSLHVFCSLAEAQKAKIVTFQKSVTPEHGHDFLNGNNTHNGTIIWTIPQFSQRKADVVNGKYTSIFSLPFYSCRYGYKMRLRLYIMGDGIGKGTHLSLFFVVMRGEFDNILQWPFTHKVTFKLINQSGGRDIVDTFQPDPMSSSFRKPKLDMNIASGCPRFVSHTELERGGFIVDDTIFIKCMIDTTTIRHP